MSKAPIFILGCSKSGTSLMRNLFDGHQDIFAVPLESHFFQYTGSWVNYFFRRSLPKKYSYEEMKDKLTNWIDFSNRRLNSVADGFTAGKWNLEVFKDVMYSRPVNTLRELSDLYIESMYAALYNKPYNNQHFVEKSVENAEFALEWLQLYPDAKFIHILRNPYSNLVAIRKFMHSTRVPFLNRALLSMHDSYYCLYKNLGLIDSSQYKVVIYEDLVSNPVETMQALSEFVGIDFDEILLAPTVCGERWSGNSTSGVNFSGVSNVNVDKWKKDITKYEVEIVNELFPHVLRDFKFETLQPGDLRKNLLPKEGLFHYMMNKISYYYLPKPKIILSDEKRKKSDRRSFVQQSAAS